ncbi:MAG: hypothetical protein IKE14_11810 [Loktanella sp.]|nr:hypothetical protein [Loktanella sp.]
MLQVSNLAVVGEGHADEGHIDDHLPSVFSGGPKGVLDGFALGALFEVTKANGQVGH